MADRIPLIVNPTVSQLQELPNADDLVLSGQLKMTGTTTGASDINLSRGDDAISVITVTQNSSNLSQLNIDCKNNAGADTQVGEFKISGGNNKIEFVSKGEVTAVQPTCLLTVPVVFTANGPIDGGDNNKPISFQNITTNVGCTTSLSPNASDITTGISSITVPSNGTYLVNALITGVNQTAGTENDDQVILSLVKQDTTIASNIKGFPNVETFPTFIFGNRTNEEFSASFSLPLTLSANDTLCVQLSHIDSSSAQIDGGYFSVTKLH